VDAQTALYFDIKALYLLFEYRRTDFHLGEHSPADYIEDSFRFLDKLRRHVEYLFRIRGRSARYEEFLERHKYFLSVITPHVGLGADAFVPSVRVFFCFNAIVWIYGLIMVCFSFAIFVRRLRNQDLMRR
jgi:hypothetical protein